MPRRARDAAAIAVDEAAEKAQDVKASEGLTTAAGLVVADSEVVVRMVVASFPHPGRAGPRHHLNADTTASWSAGRIC